MTPEDVEHVSQAITTLEAALVLLRITALGLVGLGLFGMWQWRASRWRG